MNARAAEVSALELRLGHSFKAPEWLEQALTHASVGEGARKVANNERLEFLGDRVLGLFTAEVLMAQFPAAREGDLSQRYNMLVNREACARAARRMGLGPALRLAGGESKRGGREHDTILADACEAVLAALYLDGGPDAARAVYLRYWADEIEALSHSAIGSAAMGNPKSFLQEWAASKRKPIPVYVVIARSGPDHEPVFMVEVKVDGLEPAKADGRSRQEAEKAAASLLLSREGLQ
jgi:ribonuclease III